VPDQSGFFSRKDLSVESPCGKEKSLSRTVRLAVQRTWKKARTFFPLGEVKKEIVTGPTVSVPRRGVIKKTLRPEKEKEVNGFINRGGEKKSAEQQNVAMPKEDAPAKGQPLSLDRLERSGGGQAGGKKNTDSLRDQGEPSEKKGPSRVYASKSRGGPRSNYRTDQGRRETATWH